MIIILCICTPVWAQAEPDPIASITLSVGDVYLKRTLKKQWQPIEIGMFLYEGDKLRTKDTGKAEVTFIDGSIVFLGTDTEMEFIQDTEAKTKKDSIFLFFGNIWNKVVPDVHYEVETIHALATVRGTYFNVSVKDSMEVVVKEGRVIIENEFGKVEASKNTKTSVTKDIAPQKSKIRKSKMPKNIQLTPEIYIDLNVTSMLNQEQWYKISGLVKKQGSKETITQPTELTLSTSSDLSLSSDKQSTDKNLIITAENGIFEFYINSATEKAAINISNKNMTTVTKYLTFAKPLTKKNVILEFKDATGENRRLNVLFEKQ